MQDYYLAYSKVLCCNLSSELQDRHFSAELSDFVSGFKTLETHSPVHGESENVISILVFVMIMLLTYIFLWQGELRNNCGLP